MDFYRFANGITRFGLTSEAYTKIKIPLPPLPEQRAIADILQSWDTAIEKTEALIAAKEKQFDWLISEQLRGVTKNTNSKNILGNICKIKTGKKDVNEGTPKVNILSSHALKTILIATVTLLIWKRF